MHYAGSEAITASARNAEYGALATVSSRGTKTPSSAPSSRRLGTLQFAQRASGRGQPGKVFACGSADEAVVGDELLKRSHEHLSVRCGQRGEEVVLCRFDALLETAEE